MDKKLPASRSSRSLQFQEASLASRVSAPDPLEAGVSGPFGKSWIHHCC